MSNETDRKMTEKQREMIRYLHQNILGEITPGTDSYEYKKFEYNPVNEEGSKDWKVFAETGMKDDEGTLAEAICRNWVQIFVGPRGGCRAWDSKRGRMVVGPNHCMWTGLTHHNRRADLTGV